MSGHPHEHNFDPYDLGEVRVADENEVDLEEALSPAEGTLVACGTQAEISAPRVPFAWRLFEGMVASFVLLVTLPIQIVLGLLIKRGTPGPALFFQDRVGVNGKRFRFVKFRTLYADARKIWPELYEYSYTPEEIETLKFKTMADPRVTPQGKWMRMSTLDELPNFWNVVTGDMALVGPRPEIPEMLRYYDTPEKMKKFAVRPGITGLAQISGRGRLTFHQTLDYDLEYVRTRTVWLDLKIMFLTFYRILTRDGAF